MSRIEDRATDGNPVRAKSLKDAERIQRENEERAKKILSGEKNSGKG